MTDKPTKIVCDKCPDCEGTGKEYRDADGVKLLQGICPRCQGLGKINCRREEI